MITARAVALVSSVLGRGDWGRAMLAELEELPSRRARREFAAGCLRALVLSLPALALVALTSGVLSLGLVVAALIRYPGLVTGAGTWLAVGFFAGLVVSYVVAAAGLATRLTGTGLLSAVVTVAAVTAGSWFVVGLSAAVSAPGGLSLALLGLGPAVALAAGAWATSRSHSPRVGMQCVGLASLLAGFLLFLLWAGQTVVFAGRPYDAGLRADFRSSGAGDLATYAVNDSLGSGMMLLLLVPLVSLAAGLAGAAVVARRARAVPS